MADQRSGLEASHIGNLASAAAAGPRGFSTSVSRTIGAEVERVYAAWTDQRERRQWLRNDELEVGDLTPSISLHGRWAGTRVRVFFMPRGPFRTHVTVDQEELSTGRKAEQMRKFWQARLGRLAAMLEHPRA